MNLSQSPEMQEWTIGGVRVADAMSNPNIKHREFRDDRYVAAVALGRGKVDVFYLVRVVTPGATRCRRRWRKTCTGRKSVAWANNGAPWKSAIAARSVLTAPATSTAGAARARRWRRRGILAASVLLTLAALLFALDRLFPLPPIDSGGAAVVVSADGTPLRNYPSRDGIWRYPVTPAQVSPRYLETLLTYEDRWFYWHPGVNPVALARPLAVGHQPAHRVRRLDADHADGPLDRPAAGRQAVAHDLGQAAPGLACRAAGNALQQGRDPVLYLTHAPMGGIVEGVEMGSRLWLGKPASDLSPAEAAMLTALPQAPSRLRPDRHPQAAQVARDKVLDRMVERGRWTAEAVADAKIENVIAPPLRARWLAPLAAQRLLLEAGGARRRPGERPPLVASTLDADMQASVERMLLDRVDNLPPKVSMAVLVMDNDSLEIKAYAGSADFSDDSRYAHVDMVRGVRSPVPRSSPSCMRRRWTKG